ncbi:MAG: PadR family transcriptional regulator [Microbacterium sp.]|uniref:PadR family transcriptional regulator n=1 Tax=Microbacterium sp. TaxID=51671 RepID=UPI001AC7AD13|nr:PadR family transcriptional regulator [Microbacterium sp.]MBN9177922.1 PadR family transcriptional regulator [Microbacterium sp.]
MNNGYGGQGFGGMGFGGSGDGKGVFGGQGMNDIFDALGQFGQKLEQRFDLPRFDMKAGSRMGRGDVRVAILAILAEQPLHGYQIIQQIEERSGGAWKPSPGSVYPTLQLLTDEGIVDVEEESGRKTYSLTEAGRAEAADKPAPWRASETTAGDAGAAPGASRHDGPGFGALSKSGANLAQAAMQVGRTGTPEQVQQAIDILDDARRRLYAILAEG